MRAPKSLTLLIVTLLLSSSSFAGRGGGMRWEPWSCLYTMSQAGTPISKEEIENRFDEIVASEHFKSFPTWQQMRVLMKLAASDAPMTLDVLSAHVAEGVTMVRGRLDFLVEKGFAKKITDENPAIDVGLWGRKLRPHSEKESYQVTVDGRNFLRKEHAIDSFRILRSELGFELNEKNINDKRNHDPLALTHLLVFSKMYLEDRPLTIEELSRKMTGIVAVVNLRKAFEYRFQVDRIVEPNLDNGSVQYRLTEHGKKYVERAWRMDRALYQMLQNELPNVMLGWN